jgi:murein DD-endopeptidase MepM/ murein hydrolase activator NlpD
VSFVILSTGGLTQSRLRTVSTRALVAGVGCLMLAVAAGGAWLGYHFGQSRADIGALVEMPQSLTLDLPEGRALVDRVGELAGRLIRLESEAVTLAKRVNVLHEFEAQIGTSGKPRKDSEVAGGTKAEASPSGGPLVPLLGETLSGDGVERDEDLINGLMQLERYLDRVDSAFALVDRVTTERNLQNMAFPSRPPVEGISYTSGFGRRLDPFTRIPARHTGVDFPAMTGTPILASAGGRVIFSGYRGDYGYTVEIDHGNGLVTRYAHASKLFVRNGELVMPRQRIAAVGSTGRSTGPHLHFEVMRNGSYVDPTLYLARIGS